MLWLWGGLRPIPSRLALDSLTIASLFYSALTSLHATNDALLILACVTTIATAGLTKRWTISFPMMPFLFLQGLRRFDCVTGWNWTVTTAIGVLSILLLMISAAITILFPAVELGRIRGGYNVGVVDLHLPVDFTDGVRRGSLLGTQHQHSMDDPSDAHVTARLLYPTHDQPDNLPYLDPECLDPELLCSEFMKAGAPPPLKPFGWFLHSWMLTTIRAKRNAGPALTSDGKFPLVVYSHGLTGNAAIYSYQAMNLAANGMVVLMVDHTDASAIATRRKDSSHLVYDSSLVTGLRANDIEEEVYDQRRRAQTKHRVEECLSALKVLKTLNRRNIPDLDSGVSFVGKLDLSYVTLMGHSFGGCTALAAAAQSPDLITNVVAHDPAVNWMPDEARWSLFPSERGDRDEEKKDIPHFDGSEGSSSKPTIHNVNMLFLYSDEFASKKWGHYEQVRSMHERQELSSRTSEVGVITKSHHTEFSDTCMLTPTWLARATGLTGPRNPHDTAEEIACRTVEFLEATRKEHGLK